MTREEVNAEVYRDYEKLKKSTLNRLFEQYVRERKKLDVDKTKTYPKCYSIKTTRKNTWLIFIEKSHDRARLKHCTDASAWCVVYYYAANGLRVFRPQEAHMEVFNGHFFTRYNERLGLNLPYQLDVIKAFFTNSGHMQPEITTDKDGEERTLSICRDGLALGRLHRGEMDWLVHRTFISHALKTPQQLLEQERLRLQMQESLQLHDNTPEGVIAMRHERANLNQIFSIAS